MKRTTIKEKAYIHDDEYYYNLVKKNIKYFRTQKGLTQQDLADMTELSMGYICDIENEYRIKHPTLTVIGRIAEALKIDIAEFFKER